MIGIRIKLAPRDIVRLTALCEGYDGLGVPQTLDARSGALAWCVPEALAPLALAALTAAATRIPMRFTQGEPWPAVVR